MPGLDRIDLELLAALADDPRTTIVALAENLGLSRNTIQARMARLEQSGIFLSYERSFSTDVLGFPLQAFVSIGVRQTELPASSTNSPGFRRSCRRMASADRSICSHVWPAGMRATSSTPTRGSCRSKAWNAPRPHSRWAR